MTVLRYLIIIPSTLDHLWSSPPPPPPAAAAAPAATGDNGRYVMLG